MRYYPLNQNPFSDDEFYFHLQVQKQEIIVQHPCPVPDGQKVLVSHWLHLDNHILNKNDPESFTIIALAMAWFVLFVLTCLVFIINIRKLFRKKSSKLKYF